MKKYSEFFITIKTEHYFIKIINVSLESIVSSFCIYSVRSDN